MIFTGAVLNSFCDVLVILVPIPLVLQLRLSPWRRFGVFFLFSLGIFATIAGIVKIYYVWQVFYGSYDQTWYSYGLYVSTTIELDLGVVSKDPVPFAQCTWELKQYRFAHLYLIRVISCSLT
jgi:hypothetical protein